MATNFFRKDLNLQIYRWHRLFKVLFIFSAILMLGFIIKKITKNYQYPKYTKICNLSDRLDSKIRLVGELINPNEICSSYEEDLYNRNLYYDYDQMKKIEDVYCSKNIFSQIDELQSITNVYHFDAQNYNIPKNEFITYITLKHYQFISIFRSHEQYTQDSMWHNSGWDNFNVYKVSYGKTLLSLLFLIFQISLLTVIGLILILTIYYKVVIYIIFENRK